METIARSLAVYFFLVLVMRLAGKRSLERITTFDFVLLLIISEATQEALVGEDYSVTTAATVILTLVAADIGLSLLQQKSPWLNRLLDSEPIVLVDNGRPLDARMRKARVSTEDVLSSARQEQGLARMDEIRYAVLERNGHISIVPKQS